MTTQQIDRTGHQIEMTTQQKDMTGHHFEMTTQQKDMTGHHFEMTTQQKDMTGQQIDMTGQQKDMTGQQIDPIEEAIEGFLPAIDCIAKRNHRFAEQVGRIAAGTGFALGLIGRTADAPDLVIIEAGR